jgi:signal transduction histidine kinase
VTGTPAEILSFLGSFIERAASRSQNSEIGVRVASPTICIATNKFGTALTIELLSLFSKVKEANPNFSVRYLTNIVPENVTLVKAMAALPYFEIAHLEGFAQRFAISEKEYVAVLGDLQSTLPNELVRSLNQELVDQMKLVFDRSWLSSIPSAIRLGRLNSIEAKARVRERRLQAPGATEKTVMEARLLQDILTHDLGNYNQIAKLTVELINEEASNNPSLGVLTERLLRAIDDSTQLLDTVRKLGKVLSDKNPKLYAVGLPEIIQGAINLVRKTYPQKQIQETLSFPANEEVSVLADDLIGEAFTNLLSNSVRYTNGELVPIEISIQEASEPDEIMPAWRISLIDYGTGIPDDLKEKVFNRYMQGAKGSGLGLSIVHALVVERYRGLVHVRNRVEGDYTKGTIVDLLIPKS